MRKGQAQISEQMISYWIIVLLIATVMAGSLAGMMYYYDSNTFKCASSIENEIIIAKVLYSPNCFTYYDEDTNRFMPGTIDLEKFTEEDFDACFPYLDRIVGLELEETSLGYEFTSDPVEVSKFIYVYDQDEIETSTLTFKFEELSC
tara:strand:- start:138 stop:578 length:441 start_codon:yes stop_codon:yes gene_type:complete